MVMAYILSIQVTKNEFANNVIDPIKLMPSCSLSGMAFFIKESLYYVALKSNGRLASFRISIVYKEQILSFGIYGKLLAGTLVERALPPVVEVVYWVEQPFGAQILCCNAEN